MKVYVIIETDNEGVYQSSEVIADEDIANETLRHRRNAHARLNRLCAP